MALVVEDGTGLSNADSYLSVADADTYHTAHGNPAAWSSASDADKEEALRLATQYIDVVYGRRFSGTKLAATQALRWPRNGVYDDEGQLLDNDSIPVRVEQATAELALRQLGADLLPDEAEPGDIKKEKVKVGSIVEETEYVGGKSQTARFSKVELLLADLIGSSGNIQLERG